MLLARADTLLPIYWTAQILMCDKPQSARLHPMPGSLAALRLKHWLPLEKMAITRQKVTPFANILLLVTFHQLSLYAPIQGYLLYLIKLVFRGRGTFGYFQGL